MFDREANCDNSRLGAKDLAIQLFIPSGPDNNFFAGHDIPVEVRLHGAGGVSSIAPGHTTAHIDPFNPERDQTMHGYLGFRFRTAADPDAPSYSAQGTFTAHICNNRQTVPSINELPTSESPVSGTVADREVKLRTTHAYLRNDGYGGLIVMLKSYEGDVVCHTTRSATPYLFGAEVGVGRDGKYMIGAPLPANWQMQMRAFQFSERSVHAARGAGWVQFDSVDLRGGGVVDGDILDGGVVTGRLAVDNSDDEPAWRFLLSGRFEATVCGAERQAW